MIFANFSIKRIYANIFKLNHSIKVKFVFEINLSSTIKIWQAFHKQLKQKSSKLLKTSNFQPSKHINYVLRPNCFKLPFITKLLQSFE